MLYIDPGTGSLILQVVAAAFLAASFTAKSIVHRLKRLVSGLTRGPGSDAEPRE